MVGDAYIDVHAEGFALTVSAQGYRKVTANGFIQLNIIEKPYEPIKLPTEIPTIV